MFAIATEDRQYQTYVLADQATNTQLEIVPERGGIVTRWTINNQDILYLDRERFADPGLSVRGGIPILFPICGNLPDNTFVWHGQSYTLKQHGFARDLPWTVVDQSTQADASLTLELRSSPQTRLLYPFDFHLVFTYAIRGNTLTLRQRYTNTSDTPLPFSSGFHPYFLVQDKGQLQFHIPASEVQDQRTKVLHSYTGGFDFTQDEIDVAFTELSSPVARVTDPARSLQLSLTFSPQFSTLIFWTLKGKEFYCLEPWTAGRNAINTGDRLITLAPGEHTETEFILTAEWS
jgi:galactose mutarotase-like enzyme